MDWNAFDKFEDVIDKYMPMSGEGETMASQIVTAMNKLVYKWYNDGDVYDNTYSLKGWWNDLSSYANWLYKYTDEGMMLAAISKCNSEDDYENLLYKMSRIFFNEDFLADYADKPKEGSIYECDGPFVFDENSEEEDDWEDEDNYDDFYEDEED